MKFFASSPFQENASTTLQRHGPFTACGEPFNRGPMAAWVEKDGQPISRKGSQQYAILRAWSLSRDPDAPDIDEPLTVIDNCFFSGRSYQVWCANGDEQQGCWVMGKAPSGPLLFTGRPPLHGPVSRVEALQWVEDRFAEVRRQSEALRAARSPEFENSLKEFKEMLAKGKLDALSSDEDDEGDIEEEAH